MNHHMNYQEFQYGLNAYERQLVETLGKIVKEINPKTILEIGSGWGISARIFLENTEAHLTTLDKIQNLTRFDLNVAGFEDRITRITESSQTVLPLLQRRFDLAYVDGSHVYEEVKQDLIEVITLTDIVICDDVFHEKNYNGEYGVTRAVVEVFRNIHKKFDVYLSANGLAVIYL